MLRIRECGRIQKKKVARKNFPAETHLDRTSSQQEHHISNAKMRPLTETETQALFAKLANYTGNSLKNLIAPLDNSPNSDRYVFRIQNSRCYYVRLSLANLATSISRDKLLSLGTCLGISSLLVVAPQALIAPRQVHQDR
jgi:hypothetical protein